MSLLLKPQLEQFIEEQVKTGRYASRTEVLEAGLARLMLDPVPTELNEADLAAIEESEGQIAAGEDLDWNQVSKRLRHKYLGE